MSRRGFVPMAAVIAISMTAAAFARDTLPFPSFDTDEFCRTQARYSFAATLGGASFDQVLAECVASEQTEKALARTEWASASQRLASDCLDLADGRYGYLQRCLTATTAR